MAVQKDYFVNPQEETWWLVQVTLEDALVTKRVELGQSLGWSDQDWFADRNKLEELWAWLETNQPQLLIALEEATDLDRRLRWIEDLLSSRQETDEQEAEQSSSGSSTTTDDAPAGPQAQVAAPAPEAKKNLFAKKEAAPEAATAPEPAPEAHITAAVEDKVDELRAAAADPGIEIDQKELDELLSDPAEQEAFARYLEEIDEEIEQEVEQELEQLNQETGA